MIKRTMTQQELDACLFDACNDGNMSNVQLALVAGADVNAKNALGQTPLHFTALNGHADIARLLIDRGAKVNAKDAKGRTPLELAGSYVALAAKRRDRGEPPVGE